MSKTSQFLYFFVDLTSYLGCKGSSKGGFGKLLWLAVYGQNISQTYLISMKDTPPKQVHPYPLTNKETHTGSTSIKRVNCIWAKRADFK